MKAALYQARTGIDPRRNADSLVGAIAAAAANGASVLFTPEMSGLLDRDAERASHNIAFENEDTVLRAVGAAAAEHRLWVQLGSLAVRREDGKLVNRSFLIDDAGAVRARYDKMHLFDVDLGGESWRESTRYAAGDTPMVVETPWGRLGLSICYDLRFPDLYSWLVAAGATLVAVPSAFTVPTGSAHWHVLCRARAIEMGAFVFAAAQSGRHEDGRQTFGHSLVVDPWGEVLLDMGEAQNALGYADIDLDKVAKVRTALPTLLHRRVIGDGLTVR